MTLRTMLLEHGETRRQRHADLLLAVLAAKPEGRYGTEMWRLTGVSSGAMYVALARLEKRGLATSGWQDGPEPRRRIYYATPEGRIRAAKS